MAASPPDASLSDLAYDDIRSRILDCRIAPGEFVSERALAGELNHGISATRAALAKLASDGLVTSIPRVGYQVSPITLRGVTSFFETWAIVGPPFVRLAVSRLTDDHKSAIRAITPSDESYSGADSVRVADEYFMILMDAVDNALLAEIFRRLHGDMRRLFTLAYWAPVAGGEIMQPDIRAFDPDAAERQAVAFIEHARQRTMNWVTTSTSLADVALSFR